MNTRILSYLANPPVKALALSLTRVLALATVGALSLGAQIIRVPQPAETGRPIAATLTFGFLQTESRVDGQSGTVWRLGEALSYRGTVDYGLRSGSIGVSASVASVPIRRLGGGAVANSSGDIQLRQFLGTFRTPESPGPHQIVEVGVGLAQWASYSGTDVLTADELKPRNALALVIGYGFGFSIGERAALIVVQDVSTLWGSKEGLQGGESRMVRQYTTRLGMRYRFRGNR